MEADAIEGGFVDAQTDEEFHAEFKRQFGDSITSFTRYTNRFTSLDDVRYAVWAGQSEDGRKHKERTGKAVFPWEGAADCRVRLADQFCQDDVDIMLAVLKTAKISCILSADPQNLQKAKVMEAVLDYYRKNKLSRELWIEAERAAQWRQHYGYSGTSIQWLQETGTERKTITIQDVVALSQRDSHVAALLSLLAPVLEGSTELTEATLQPACALLKRYIPDIPDDEKCVKDLCKDGTHEYDHPYLKENRPKIYALKVGLDLFFNINTDTAGTAQWMAQRVLLSAAELEDRARIDEWDEEFVEGCKKRIGHSILWSTLAYWTSRAMLGRQYTWMDDMKNVTEVFYVWVRAYEDGNQKTYKLVFHPNEKNFGKKETNPFEHGKIPFVDHVRERCDRFIVSSRGVTELLSTNQFEIKTQRDYRIDRTTIDVLPPLTYPLMRGKTQYTLGPGVQVGVMQQGELAWLGLPEMSETTINIEESTRKDVNDYFGKRAEGVDPNKIVQKTQRLVDSWLNEWKEIFNQIGQLAQQYLPDPEVQRICDLAGITFKVDPDSLRGQWDITIDFDARDLDMEFMKNKLELITQFAIPADAGGVIDRNQLTRIIMQTIDPKLAQLLCRDDGQASQAEIQDERSNLVSILNAVAPPMVEKGQNFQLRLQTLQQTIGSSPTINAMINGNPEIKKLLEQRLKFLQFQIQQQQNATTGKLGVQPSAGQPVTATQGQVGGDKGDD
jgi:hypothetical protein